LDEAVRVVSSELKESFFGSSSPPCYDDIGNNNIKKGIGQLTTYNTKIAKKVPQKSIFMHLFSKIPRKSLIYKEIKIFQSEKFGLRREATKMALHRACYFPGIAWC
jgi:hypothetical protein